MNLVEILKAKGVSDELIAAIQEDMKANSIYTASEENLDIRYGKLKNQNDTLKGDYETLKKDHETLKQSAGDSAELLKQSGEKDATIAALQKQLLQTKIEAKAHTKLLAAGFKPEDLEYLTFKLNANGEMKLDDKEEIEGIDDKISALKTQVPASLLPAGRKNIMENHLPDNREHDDSGEPKSLADALRMQYEENN